MRKLIFILSVLILSLSVCAQEIEVSGTRKAVRTSGDVGALLLPVAGVTAVLLQKDWQGLKQGVFSGVTTLGVTYALKYIVKKNVPTVATIIHFHPCTHLLLLPPQPLSNGAMAGSGDCLPTYYLHM